eukprot:4282713-Pyramimonas_sp.AAC.1
MYVPCRWGWRLRRRRARGRAACRVRWWVWCRGPPWWRGGRWRTARCPHAHPPGALALGCA